MILGKLSKLPPDVLTSGINNITKINTYEKEAFRYFSKPIAKHYTFRAKQSHVCAR